MTTREVTSRRKCVCVHTRVRVCAGEGNAQKNSNYPGTHKVFTVNLCDVSTTISLSDTSRIYRSKNLELFCVPMFSF